MTAPVNIDQETFERLCVIQPTLQELASFFGCSEKAVQRWTKRTYGKTFSEVFADKRSKGFVSLRRAQFQSAIDGSVPMQIWLGKNWLGQADRQVVDVRSAVPVTLVDDLDDYEEQRLNEAP